jgi:hypothetical protein
MTTKADEDFAMDATDETLHIHLLLTDPHISIPPSPTPDTPLLLHHHSPHYPAVLDESIGDDNDRQRQIRVGAPELRLLKAHQNYDFSTLNSLNISK